MDLLEALQRLSGLLPRMKTTEPVEIAGSRGRVLAKSVTAPVDLPPFAASAMDGYAVRGADFSARPTSPLRLVGESLAGHPYTGTVGAGECARVFTGAMVPDGADQVLLQEDVDTVDGNAVTFRPHEPAESYVRPIGHDIKRGAALAAAGEVLAPFTLGALVASGVSSVEVYTRPRVGVFSTGDELADPGTALDAGQIYDSNRFTVLQLLATTPCELLDLGRVPDDADAVTAAFTDATARCDVLITSGGVSVGEADFVTTTIESLGTLEFWRLNLKPGKPLAFGQIGGCRVFGLPGNPVSTIVTLLLIARPALWFIAGAEPRPPLRITATLAESVNHNPGRAEYQRGRFEVINGGLHVRATGDQSSNRLQTFRGADCLIEIPKDAGDLPAGSPVTVLPFDGLL